jgi:Glutamine amidotransferase class-I
MQSVAYICPGAADAVECAYVVRCMPIGDTTPCSGLHAGGQPDAHGWHHAPWLPPHPAADCRLHHSQAVPGALHFATMGTVQQWPLASCVWPFDISLVLQREQYIEERHRHRYEVNPDLVEQLEQHGLRFVGKDETVRLQ